MEREVAEAGPKPLTLWTRRLLVVVWLASILLVVTVTWAGLPAWVQLLGLLAVIVTSIALRAAARTLGARRFQSSYFVVVALVTASLAVAWIAADTEQISWQATPDQILAVLFGFSGLAAALPSAILAWSARPPSSIPPGPPPPG